MMEPFLPKVSSFVEKKSNSNQNQNRNKNQFIPIAIPPEYDIANLLYLPKNYSENIHLQAQAMNSKDKTTNQNIQNNCLFCDCGLPMMDKYEVGKFFCLDCGLTREFQENLTTFQEEPTPRASNGHTKKNSQISSNLNLIDLFPLFLFLIFHLMHCVKTANFKSFELENQLPMIM